MLAPATAEPPLPHLDAELPPSGPDVVRELRGEQRFHAQFREFCRELATEPGPATTPAVLAHEYQRLFQADRAWVLTARGRSWHVAAVSGIPAFQRRAEVVRHLERLTELVARTRQPLEWSAGTACDASARLRAALDQYLDEAHVSGMRVEPLLPRIPDDADSASEVTPPRGMVVCEWFQPPDSAVPELWWTAAREQGSLALEQAWDWSAAPLAALLRRWRRTTTWQMMSRRSVLWLTVVLVTCGLAAWPMEYTIDAVGELQPVNQRHVFATSTGIIRALHVSTGDAVEADETLLELESPELEVEYRRLEGELQTTDKKVAAIEASRLDHVRGSDDSEQNINLLTGELSELRQRRVNLRNELAALAVRRDDLRTRSPIAGQVVTWDLGRLLTRRPVTRGQRLLTVAETHGPWQLELRVPDDQTGELQSAIQRQDQMRLEFIVVTQPGRVRQSTLRTISETVDIRRPDEGPTCLCLADVPEEVSRTATTGLSVRARILCGRRPAVAVYGGRMWRVIQERVLFAWGW